MEPEQISKVKPGSPVWVWVVRLGNGRWWPGRVESVGFQDRLPLLKVRFECQTPYNRKSEVPREVGTTSARMRYVEPRDPHVKAIDQPHFAPTPLIEKEEKPTAAMLAMDMADEQNGQNS
jgi:hypothetical protein